MNYVKVLFTFLGLYVAARILSSLLEGGLPGGTTVVTFYAFAGTVAVHMWRRRHRWLVGWRHVPAPVVEESSAGAQQVPVAYVADPNKGDRDDWYHLRSMGPGGIRPQKRLPMVTLCNRRLNSGYDLVVPFDLEQAHSWSRMGNFEEPAWTMLCRRCYECYVTASAETTSSSGAQER
ncbi:hypothetical protein GCM10027451_32880 [Geodermatophilus aquaeductus]|uniref:hypothetical protein n=1 Tax=Geodermatophilus aquaeductus TaxID=1564161 RepID=UPI00115C256A|nr:hypothetical protein [Geodermatophilus aquaeductus]